MLAETGQFPNYFSEEAMRRVGKELVLVSGYEGTFIPHVRAEKQGTMSNA
jgi:hypothetical protein